MTQMSLESHDLSISKLFTEFYQVPSYQREYVWEGEQVEQLLDDIYQVFLGNDTEKVKEDLEYFIGSIVVVLHQDSVFELIDGQQRLTTLFLWMCALRDHLYESSNDQIDALNNQLAAADIDNEGNNIFRYRIVLQYEDSQGILQSIAERTQEELSGGETRSVKNLVSAYNILYNYIAEKFSNDSVSMKKFYVFLTKNVKIIRVETKSLTHALKVFETINDRGVGLDPMDLLKNLLFMHTKEDQYEILKSKWKYLIDTLHQIPEKPLRFIRYYILANYPVDRLREEDVYKWFLNNSEISGLKKQPMEFVNQLIKSCNAYANFNAGRNVDGTGNKYLMNLKYLSGTAKQHYILLLSAINLETKEFTELSKQIESLFFIYIISRHPTNIFERDFNRWSLLIKNIDTEVNLQKFILQQISPAKNSLRPKFIAAFSTMHEFDIQRYRLKYVLAKIAQFVDEELRGVSPEAFSLSRYMDPNIEIEHILPRKPIKSIVKQFDKPDEIKDYTQRIGNLTLLEKSINSSISNGDFNNKKLAFAKSGIILTQSLAISISVGKASKYAQMAQILTPFDQWKSTDIEDRQDTLVLLAQKIWGI